MLLARALAAGSAGPVSLKWPPVALRCAPALVPPLVSLPPMCPNFCAPACVALDVPPRLCPRVCVAPGCAPAGVAPRCAPAMSSCAPAGVAPRCAPALVQTFVWPPVVPAGPRPPTQVDTRPGPPPSVVRASLARILVRVDLAGTAKEGGPR